MSYFRVSLVGAMACLLVTGCVEEPDAPAAGVGETGATTESQTFDAEAPGDGSSICPGSDNCPPDETGGGGGVGFRGRQWYGVIIPESTPNNIVCVAGRRGNPSECPNDPGKPFSGRLWTSPGAQGGSPLQVVCTPEVDNAPVCETEKLKGKFAFLCLARQNQSGDPVASACPGVPTRRGP